jgi:hypothetical protein
MIPSVNMPPSVLKRQIRWRENRIYQLRRGLENYENLLRERLEMDRSRTVMTMGQSDGMDSGGTG